MTKTITLGKRLVPIEQIALVEPFDPSTQPNIRSTRPFRSRVVLLNRDSILAEVDPTGFAEEHGFRMLPLDGVATNPETNFGVERFEASGDFQPTKPFVSRLSWRDRDGNTQSKLLLSEAEICWRWSCGDGWRRKARKAELNPRLQRPANGDHDGREHPRSMRLRKGELVGAPLRAAGR